MFPVETIENILSFCDGKTLFCAREVDATWRKSVEYLTQKTDIWKYCCSEDIPADELIEYVQKFVELQNKDYWLHMYENWVSWQNISLNVKFDIILCPVEVPRITCIAVAGRYIAVGSEDGRVKIYNLKWDLLCVERFLAVKVTRIQFIWDDERKDFLGDMYMLITYKTHSLFLIDYHTRIMAPIAIHDVMLHSVYKTYACFVKRGGRISIVQLVSNPATKVVSLIELTYIRIYSPNEVTSVTMWKGVCTFLINNDVKVVRYDHEVQPISIVKNKASLKFCVKDQFTFQKTSQIYRDNIIVNMCSDEDPGTQVLEIFLLGVEKACSKKMFDSWEALKSNITCMYLYGNTFVIGVDIGNVYFYHVNSWKEFDIRMYQQKIIVGKHPIISIDVRETKEERMFYVATTVNIHKLVGYTVSNYT